MARKKYDLTGKLGVDEAILEDLTREVDEQLVEAIQAQDPTEEQIESREAYWDMFRNENERKEARLPKIRDIPLDQIDDFPDHPYKVRDDEDMMQLIESVMERGVITPATVRRKEDGRYELISGHRRKRASELAGLTTLRCEVVTMDRNEATILMVESNFQRSEILPSEKAFAYKMRMNAIKRKAGRPSKENSCPVGANLFGQRSDEILAKEGVDSARQIQRYIRLTNLVPELLEIVDDGKMKMRPAIEISYLDEETQRELVDIMDEYSCTPSHDQAIRMRSLFEDGGLTRNAIEKVMGEEKPNQKNRIVLRENRISGLLPKNLADKDREEYVIKALRYYKQMQIQRKDRMRDER